MQTEEEKSHVELDDKIKALQALAGPQSQIYVYMKYALYDHLVRMGVPELDISDASNMKYAGYPLFIVNAISKQHPNVVVWME